MARLAGRTAVVPGGAKGIGRHYSLALAAEGARVMIADIADGKELAQEIAAKHGANSVASAIADVGDESSVKDLVAATMERFGKIDVLVNNAALFAPLQETKCTEIDAELWDKVMAVNLRGPFLMVKHVAPHMIAQGYGKIIKIGSGPAFRGIPWMLHYVTSKGGIMAFTRALARELGTHGIRVNTLAPGFTMSDTVVSENPGHVATARNRAVQSRSLQRDEHPQDLLGALVFLASGDSDFVTGQTLAVDGGNVNTGPGRGGRKADVPGFRREIVSLYTNCLFWIILNWTADRTAQIDRGRASWRPRPTPRKSRPQAPSTISRPCARNTMRASPSTT